MSSDWKEGASKRRDVRHTKSSDETSSTAPNKRNTKKWCRGKEGVSHQPKCMEYAKVKGVSKSWAQSWRLLVCEGCGKELEIWFGDMERKPEWVSN